MSQFPAPADVWQSLTVDQRRFVLDHRHDTPLPNDLIQTLAAAGAVLVGVRWESDNEGFAFFFPEAWINFLESDEAQA